MAHSVPITDATNCSPVPSRCSRAYPSPMPTAVVTGAGRGLGRAVSEALAARGLTLHATDVDAEAAERTAADLDRGAFFSPLDVRDESACRKVAAATVERAGSLDVWVNNAGILVPGLAWEQGEETRRLMLEVNAVGTMNGTVAALEQMLAAGSGQVINVVSMAGLVAAPGEVSYAASKHAAIAFTLGTLFDLRRSGIKGIHLSAVCPDGIWTPMLEDKLDDPDAAGSFSGTLLTAEEVAPRIAALLDRPQPILTIPRRRGAVLRLFDAFPSLTIRLTPLLMRNAERRQRHYKHMIEWGGWPQRGADMDSSN
jgi:NAD(P)-dependent dehydrogenase (short-subunit alcohol dehydrogenase family)